MNLREGTRRLALLLGVVGALLGGFLSYSELQSLIHQGADHQRFEQLANSQLVQQQRINVQRAIMHSIPTPTENGPVTVIGPDRKTYHFPEGTDKDAAVRYFKLEGIGTYSAGIDDPINRDGIKSVHWSKAFDVDSFEMEDGQTLYPMPAPGAWSYVPIAVLPLLGFFLPWGAVRAIGWVGAGFVAGPK